MNNAKSMVATIFFEALALQTWSTMMHIKHQANWFELMKLNKMGRRMQVGWLVSPMNIWQFAQESLDCDQQKCCGVGWIPTFFVKSQHCWPTELPESTAFVATKKVPYLFLYGRDPNISSLNTRRSPTRSRRRGPCWAAPPWAPGCLAGRNVAGQLDMGCCGDVGTNPLVN